MYLLNNILYYRWDTKKPVVTTNNEFVNFCIYSIDSILSVHFTSRIVIESDFYYFNTNYKYTKHFCMKRIFVYCMRWKKMEFH